MFVKPEWMHKLLTGLDQKVSGQRRDSAFLCHGYYTTGQEAQPNPHLVMKVNVVNPQSCSSHTPLRREKATRERSRWGGG